MCAIEAAKRGRKTLVLDHGSKVGSKILISGGGRCNFTNLTASSRNYVSENRHFCKSALARFTPRDFLAMVQEHQIAYHEKKLGQLFCDGSASNVVSMLVKECENAGVILRLGAKIKSVVKLPNTTFDGATLFEVTVSSGGALTGQVETLVGSSVVIATGGLSIPKIGATGFGYEIAKQFGLKVLPRSAALDGFTFSSEVQKKFSELSGLSLDCLATCGGESFRENVLFTHSGLSGPAALQTSLHWKPGLVLELDLLPELSVEAAEQWLIQGKQERSQILLSNFMKEKFPARFIDFFCEAHQFEVKPLIEIQDKTLKDLIGLLKHWKLEPRGTVGYQKAEVTRGGVDTDELSSKTLESKKVPGLFFVGEVVDVTGWLGGYNFQWAWSSGWAAGQVV